MKNILIVYNPRSSRFKDVRMEVLDFLVPKKMAEMGKNGVTVGKYEILETTVEDNIKKLKKLLADGMTVVAVGGDATGVIAANAIIDSGKDAVLSVLPYGNFNDLARTLGLKKITEIWDGKVKKLWPLEIVVDGEHFRYATSYVTVGMTAEAVEIFDDERIRKELQKGSKSSWKSYLELASWYFKNRKKKNFIPKFKLNGKAMSEKTTDYAAVNGRSMARVMRGADWCFDAKYFQSETGELANFGNLFVLMARSILARTPGGKTCGDTLEFDAPAKVEIQAEGEYKMFEGISKLEIRKAKKCLKVLVK